MGAVVRNKTVLAALVAALATAPVAAHSATAAPELVSTLPVEAAAPRVDWWAGLEDPLLNQIVAYAMSRNRDLRAAEAQVRQARASAKAEGWSLLPLGGLNVSGGRQRDASLDQQGGFVAAGGEVTWEADVFGRLRANVSAARLDALSLEEARRGAMTAIASQIASTYVELRGAQTRLAATEANATAQAATLRLTEVLRDAGRSTPLDVMRAQAQLEATRAAGPLLQAQIAEDIAALDVLAAGLTPEMTAALKAQSLVPDPPRRLAIGTPEELLRRRPDIRQAEARLAAAQARARAAKVDWWPRLSFVAQGAATGANVAALNNNAGFSFVLGPRIDWPALDFRRNALRLEAARAGADVEYQRYEKLVLSGARDLDASLASLAGALQAEANYTTAVEAARRAAGISRLRYREGADPFFAVLDAERTLAGFEDSLAVARTRSALAYVRVGQALGAGWSD
ncbi:TolC family protein [Phenylobacterium sp. LjRoot225]|uniref:efflux transporter outer membrane subunit n=1 Tax=Phenylobacterium sp. LjRoot225 TaxID=3342285 RepID=UPI003ED017A1